MTPHQMATRFRVFRYLKMCMEADGECPTGIEVADALGIDVSTARYHARALDGADGLPFHVLTRNERLNDLNSSRLHSYTASMNAIYGRSFDINEVDIDVAILSTYIPLDREAWQ